MYNFSPSFSSYIALSGIWIVLSLFYLFLYLTRPEGGGEIGLIMSLCMVILFISWLKGMRITIKDRVLIYRDGLYRKKFIEINDIISVTIKWVELKNFGHLIKLPRMVISTRQNNVALLINVKPFKKEDIKKLTKLLTTVYE